LVAAVFVSLRVVAVARLAITIPSLAITIASLATAKSQRGKFSGFVG